MAASSKSDPTNNQIEEVMPMSKPSPPFFSLPAEVRLIIYRYFIATLTVFLHRRRNCKGKIKPQRFSPLNLFLTNGQMRDEFMPIYFSDCLFTFEQNTCSEGKCDLYSNLSRHQSPHFQSIQRVECTDRDIHFFLLLKGSVQEITLLVDFYRWLHLVGYADQSSARLWSYYCNDESYPECLLEWLGGTPKKVILQRDWSGQPRFSPWRDNLDEPLPVLPSQEYQKIVLERGQVVIWGIEPDRHTGCEAALRDVFKIPTDTTVRFEGTPVNGIYYK